MSRRSRCGGAQRIVTLHVLDIMVGPRAPDPADDHQTTPSALRVASAQRAILRLPTRVGSATAFHRRSRSRLPQHQRAALVQGFGRRNSPYYN